MKDGLPFGAVDLRDYAKARGWTQIDEAVAKRRLYILKNSEFPNRQLIFPVPSSAPDYYEALSLAVEKLAEIEKRSVDDVASELATAREDGISLRIKGERDVSDSLPLDFARGVVRGVEQLLLSAASTVLVPQPHHPRLGRSQAQQLLQATKFRHTEEASFGFRISCPTSAVDVPADLFPQDGGLSFVRRTMIVIDKALRQLVSAIEGDTLGALVSAATAADAKPELSSNLCDALTLMHDKELNNAVEVSVSWAVSGPAPQPVPPIRLEPEYFQPIQEVGRLLRSPGSDQHGAFVGTVEQLNGEMGDDGRRSGEAVLALLLREDNSVVYASVNLTADQYALAIEAHKNKSMYVQVHGRLHPGRQPRSLTEVTRFALIDQ